MNNERYLFRGRRTDGKEWVQGYLVYTGGWPAGDENDKYLRDYYVITNGYTQDEVDPATIGQCTGLRDKNGALIFEGDIVRVPYRKPEDSIVQVVYRGAGFIGLLSDGCEDTLPTLRQTMEICGNVHDKEATP